MLSTSEPKRGREFDQVVHTCEVPSGCWATPTIWKRSARLACGPPRAASVVERVTTRPGHVGLRPGRPGLVCRNVHLSRSGCFVFITRSTTIPAPPWPWMEPGSGENAWMVTAVAGAVDVVVLATVAAFFLLPELQAAVTTAIASAIESTPIRRMGANPTCRPSAGRGI